MVTFTFDSSIDCSRSNRHTERIENGQNRYHMNRRRPIQRTEIGRIGQTHLSRTHTPYNCCWIFFLFFFRCFFGRYSRYDLYRIYFLKEQSCDEEVKKNQEHREREIRSSPEGYHPTCYEKILFATIPPLPYGLLLLFLLCEVLLSSCDTVNKLDKLVKAAQLVR